MAVKAAIPFLVGMMLVTGVCNTLLTKYQDLQCVRNCSSTNPKDHEHFEQPLWQTLQMFVGEMGCWLAVALSSVLTRFSSAAASASSSKPRYAPLSAAAREPTGADDDDDDDDDEDDSAAVTLADTDTDDPEQKQRRPLTGWKLILLALPACCDIAGTTLMNVGLLFVAASIYQMTRGALVLFVGLFSVLFLKRHLGVHKWFALVVVVAGVAVVGLAGYLEQKPDALVPRPKLPGAGDGAHGLALLTSRTAADDDDDVAHADAVHAVIGVLLIALAQVFTATQFVVEESIMERFALQPLRVVGWEGLFGLVVTGVAMAVLHATVGSTPAGHNGYFDVREGWREICSNRAIAVSSLLIMISIGGFNFFGLSVTRSVSATSRSTIDTCRTLFIWMFSLGLGWESFKWLQVLGFAGLVYGTFLFNDIIRPPGLRWLRRRVRAPTEAEVLPEAPLEHH